MARASGSASRAARSTCSWARSTPGRVARSPRPGRKVQGQHTHTSLRGQYVFTLERSGPAGARRTLARPRPRRTSSLPPTLISARPPTRAWEVARTAVAPPSSVVKCLWGVLVWGFGLLFLSCGGTRTTTQTPKRTPPGGGLTRPVDLLRIHVAQPRVNPSQARSLRRAWAILDL